MSNQAAKTSQKGRSGFLIKKRNELLVKRFYYWYELKKLRRDLVLETLSEEEFFLNAEYINTILLKLGAMVKEIKSRKPTEKNLKEFKFNKL
ncbi:MAG TPA: hypothetical protein VF623_14135 [Segetibacter sp.]|jgi:hypothetical protein